MTPPISLEAGGPASRNGANQQFRKGAGTLFRKAGLAALLMSVTTLGGCAHPFIPPDINYDEATPAKLTVDPPAPVKIVELPKLLPLPGQLKPLPGGKAPPEVADPTARVNQANAAARIQPMRAAFINAVQVYPFSGGALYQVYTAPGEITDIALQDGEQLVGSGPVAAGDTVRWIIGDTESGAGATKKVHILVKPTRSDLVTNLIINTDRRTYMASVSWQYPEDQLIALRQQNATADAAAPIAVGVNLASINFRYAIQGDNPAWRPLRAFDDGQKVYIEFPTGISQGEMPPLFVVGPAGGSELVNYRVSRNYYIVDRLFGAAELRLGDKDSERRVRIVRTDGRRGHDCGRRTGPTKRPRARHPAGLAASGRAAARHAPLAKGAYGDGLCLGARRRRRARLRASDPQQGRRRPGTSEHPEPSFGRRPRGPAEGLYWPAAPGAAARTGAARRSRPADPQRRRCAERRGSGNGSRSGGAAPRPGDRRGAGQPPLRPDRPTATER
jgi:P-type conjugative transfer protein TrbG